MNRVPSKAERAVLKKFKRLDERAHKIERYVHGDLTPGYRCFGYSHAIEGVRTNGLEKPITCLDAHRDFSNYAAALERYALAVGRGAAKAQAIADRADAIMAHLKVCGACKGQKGRHVESTPGSGVSRHWRDCETCDGAGVVPRAG